MNENIIEPEQVASNEQITQPTNAVQSLPAEKLDIPVVDTSLDIDTQISAISSTPTDSDKKFSIFHYSNQGFAGVMKIARGTEIGVKQNKQTQDPKSNLTFGVVPMVGWASQDSCGFEYHIPRNQIAAPGETVTNLHKFVLNEDGTMGIIGKTDKSYLSMLDYEGKIAICPVTKLSDQEAGQIDQINHWTEESREKLAVPKQRISVALLKLADILRPTTDLDLPSGIVERSLTDSALHLSANVTVNNIMSKDFEDNVHRIAESLATQTAKINNAIQKRKDRTEVILPILENMTRSLTASKKNSALSILFGSKKRGLSQLSLQVQELKENGIANIDGVKFDPESTDSEVYSYIKYLVEDNARTINAYENARPHLEQTINESEKIIAEIDQAIDAFKTELKNIYS